MENPTAATSLEALRERLDGELVLPGGAAYDDARRTWNGRFDQRPAAIARCADPDDVAAAVAAAREHGLAVSVKSTGHDYAGVSVCDGGLVIDVSSMDGVEVDPGRRVVRVGPGATWAAVDAATQAHGLATPGGTVSTVGVAGFTLGGGMGWLTRKHGLALDNLLAAELITADGRHVRASDDQNADLFWALRGAGANFGVVTALELRLHPVGPEVVVAQAFHPIGAAGDALRFYRDFMAGAPEEVHGWLFILRVPPVEPFPEVHHGQPAAAFVACHCGDVAEGEAALAPIGEFGEPILSMVAPMPYTALQQSFDAGMPEGVRWYSRAHALSSLPDEAVEVFIEHVKELPGTFTMAYLGAEDGAGSRVETSATAYPHRDSAYGVHVFPGWSDPADDEEHMRWARDVHRALEPWATGGAYVNLVNGDEEGAIRMAYGANLERLRELKRQWDPDNLFRMNRNVEPAS